MRQLLPRATDSGDLSDHELAQLYATGNDGPPLLRVNMVATLDGGAQGSDGTSGSINNEADQAVYQLLRAWSDVVLVGARTVRAESYGAARTPERWTTLRAGRSAHPVIAVVTSAGDLPHSVRDAPSGAVLLVTTEEADARESEKLLEREQVLRAGNGVVDLRDAVQQLHARGLVRVLGEGGPTLLGQLLHHDLVDELCLTWSPLLVSGEATRIAVGPALTATARLASLLEQDGTLIGRWRL